jgi:hypothetical protein
VKLKEIRQKIQTKSSEIINLQEELRELNSQLIKELHQFKEGDIVQYKKHNETITGKISVIKDYSGVGANAVIYKQKKDGTYSKKYEHLCLFNWGNKDEALTVIS